MKWVITYEQCLAQIGECDACTYCGGPISPIETVDNAGNPTHWKGCKQCCKFDHGVPKPIFEYVKSLGSHRSPYETSCACWLLYGFWINIARPPLPSNGANE